MKKLGPEIVRSTRIYNHCPFDNLVPAGSSKDGSPILANRIYMEAEVRERFGGQTLYFRQWQRLMDHLASKHCPGTRAAVFPCSSLQFPIN
jgi:hypothetical protein